MNKLIYIITITNLISSIIFLKTSILLKSDFDQSFHILQENFKQFQLKSQIQTLTYKSQNVTSPQITKTAKLCSLKTEKSVISFYPNNNTAEYWVNYFEEPETSLIYQYELQPPHLILYNKQNLPEMIILQIIDLDLSSGEVIGLAGPIDFYVSFCDSINSKN